MKKEKGWRKIRAAAVMILLAAILVSVFPVQVVAAAEAEQAKDFSADFVYRATSDAIDNLWKGQAPRRSDVKIISKLPTPAAEQVIQVIIGQPEGAVPPEWISEKPGKYEIKAPEGTSKENLRAENFEFTFVNLRSGDEYTWKAEEEIPGIFPAGYFELRNKKARGETLKWYEESRLSSMEGKILPKLTESIGKRLSNELHHLAHPLDAEIVPEMKEIASKIAAGEPSKDDIAALREKVEEAKEISDGIHDMMHEFEHLVEETGKGEETVLGLHGKSHEVMAFQSRISDCVGKMEGADDPDKIREKAEEIVGMIEEGFHEAASYMHTHSTDPAGIFTGLLPLKLKDGREIVVIKHEDLTTYLSEVGSTEKGPAPIGGAVSFVIIVVGLIAVVIVRYRRR
jgi:hypothetical protein